MEFLNFKAIKTKQNRRSILYKKPNPEDISAQFYSLARELDHHKLYSGLCHLAVNTCLGKDGQVGAYLNAARSFSKATFEITSLEDHVQSVKWVYKEALLTCDSSFMAPIHLELGRYYETRNLYIQASECYKQSMSISRCVLNLLRSKRYSKALEELKNAPSHLLSSKDNTTMFLLELLLAGDVERDSSGLDKPEKLTCTSWKSAQKTPTDDYNSDLNGLLESLSIVHHESRKQSSVKNEKIKRLIIEKLSAFLDQAQIQLLYLLYDKPLIKNS